MKWIKISIGGLFTYLFGYLGYLSLQSGESIAVGLSRFRSSSEYDLIGWKAYVMGIGWLGAALCVFSLCCLGGKLEKEKWHRVGGSFGALVFGICLCIVATVSVINMVSKNAF